MNLNEDLKGNKENNLSNNRIVLEDLNSKIKYNNFPLFNNNIKINPLNKENENNNKKENENSKIKNKEIEKLKILYNNGEIELKKLEKKLFETKENLKENINIENEDKEVLILKKEYDEISNYKNNKDKELSELLNVMKKYSEELNEKSILLEEINTKNISLKSLNNKLKEKKKEKNNKKDELKIKMNKYIEIEINKTEENNDKINYDNNILDEELLYQKINDLKMKIKEIEQFKNIYEDQKLNLKITKKYLDDYFEKNKINKKIIEDNEEILNNLIYNINNTLNEIIEWIIYNFGEINDIICQDNKIEKEEENEENIEKENKEQKKEKEIFKDNDKIKYFLLYKTLMEKNLNIKNKYNCLIKRKKKLESEYKEIYSKYNELNNINDNNKSCIENSLKQKNKLIDELNTLQKFVNDLNFYGNNDKKISSNEDIIDNDKNKNEGEGKKLYNLKLEIEELNEKYNNIFNENNILENQLNNIRENLLPKEEENNNKKNKNIIAIKNEINKKETKNNFEFKNCENKLIMFDKQNKMLKNNRKILFKNLCSFLKHFIFFSF